MHACMGRGDRQIKTGCVYYWRRALSRQRGGIRKSACGWLENMWACRVSRCGRGRQRRRPPVCCLRLARRHAWASLSPLLPPPGCSAGWSDPPLLTLKKMQGAWFLIVSLYLCDDREGITSTCDTIRDETPSHVLVRRGGQMRVLEQAV
jgi:hypothetical protein